MKNSEAIYSFTIPVFVRTLKNLEKMLSKTEQHAARHKIEPEALLSAQLFPDMYSLLQQLQYACFIPVDFAKHFATDPEPRVGYDESNFIELKASIKQTIEYLQGMNAKQFEGREKSVLPLFFDGTKGLTIGSLCRPSDLAELLLSRDDGLRHPRA